LWVVLGGGDWGGKMTPAKKGYRDLGALLLFSPGKLVLEAKTAWEKRGRKNASYISSKFTSSERGRRLDRASRERRHLYAR